MSGANGATLHSISPDGTHSTHAWKVLARLLPSRDLDTDIWWQLTGRQLAVLLDAAAYPIERQYECLLYHYHYATPYLGPAPRLGSFSGKWKSMLQLDGTPLEMSWKWNTSDGEPDVRIGLEPISPMAGTSCDPLNHSTTREILHGLVSVVPGVNLGWTHHFLATLFDHDYAKYTAEADAGAQIGTSLIFSLEFLRNSTGLKTYIQPRRLNQHGFLEVPHWEASFQDLHPDAPARAAVHDFLATSPEGRLMNPFCLSVDNGDPANARLKWYFNNPHTSFSAIREIMTLGGRIPTDDTRAQQFNELFDLLKTLTDQPPTFPSDSEFPYVAQNGDSGAASFAEVPEMLKGCVYFFDISPGKPLPAIKFYFPVRNHCRNDLVVTQNFTRWLDSRGRGQYGAAFLRALEAVADYRRLDEGIGLQSFVSCQFKSSGNLELTSYLNPEAFHSARSGPRRATRRRGD